MTYGTSTTSGSKPTASMNMLSLVVRGIPYHSSKPRSLG
ncbi:Uncharacterised protein [Bordetella pertussis]|nr:Uncharacterised protein [Bordetella pertussis]CFW30951.1 Uncharacterised protein [Bordetella pertussis]CPL28633.1 Uncharacterised protein [Bordetella pertussis]CPN23296.1 Uncharacterised protein [Bordetella pertussis]